MWNKCLISSIDQYILVFFENHLCAEIISLECSAASQVSVHVIIATSLGSLFFPHCSLLLCHYFVVM